MKKTNWKIVLIVIIVLLVALWLIFWKTLFSNSSVENPEIEEESIQSSEIIDLDSWSSSLEDLLLLLD